LLCSFYHNTFLKGTQLLFPEIVAETGIPFREEKANLKFQDKIEAIFSLPEQVERVSAFLKKHHVIS